jgi:hypothetical protein
MNKVVRICITLFVASIIFVLGYYVWAMSYQHVTESESWVSLNTAISNRKDLFKDFPSATREVRFSNTIAGMRGWCFVYELRAPIDDLHTFAQSQLKEFSANIIRTDDSPCPYSEITVDTLRHGYSVKVGWLLEAKDVSGVKYEVAGNRGPTIFVDAASETMYYVFTD